MIPSVVAAEVAGALGDFLAQPENLARRPYLSIALPFEPATELRRVFVDWVRRLAERLAPPGAASPPMRTLEELKMTLEERVAEWPKQWLQEGIEQGVKQGVKQGIEQGVKQGIEQGLMHERALLRRQAALRFGEEAAARAAPALERITDPEGLAVAGDWIVRADDGDELVARLMQLAEGRDTP